MLTLVAFASNSFTSSVATTPRVRLSVTTFPLMRVDPFLDGQLPATNAEIEFANGGKSNFELGTMSEEDLARAKANRPDEATRPPPPEKVAIVSKLRVGDKQLAGDYGFDPLQLADSPKTLAFYREAEIKHARLAMLAAAGWPVAEIINKDLSSAVGLPSLLVDGRVPSILNGGLGAVNIAYWVAVLGAAVYVESTYLDKQLSVVKDVDYVPGMLGFDLFGADSPALREAEILNGRVAMVSVVVFALEEALGKAPVISETPIFFQPIWTTFGA